MTASTNFYACHFTNNFTLKSRLQFMSSTCITITRTCHSSDLAIRLPFISHQAVHSWYTRFTRQETLRNAAPYIQERHTGFYSRLHILLQNLKECPVYRPTKTVGKMQYNTNHNIQFMINITPTCFGTRLPSSGSLLTFYQKSITPFQVIIALTVYL